MPLAHTLLAVEEEAAPLVLNLRTLALVEAVALVVQRVAFLLALLGKILIKVAVGPITLLTVLIIQPLVYTEPTIAMFLELVLVVR